MAPEQVCVELLGEATSPVGSGPVQAVAAAAGSSRAGGSGLEQAVAAARSACAGESGPVQAAAAARFSRTGESGPVQAAAAAGSSSTAAAVREAHRTPWRFITHGTFFNKSTKAKVGRQK